LDNSKTLIANISGTDQADNYDFFHDGENNLVNFGPLTKK